MTSLDADGDALIVKLAAVPSVTSLPAVTLSWGCPSSSLTLTVAEPGVPTLYALPAAASRVRVTDPSASTALSCTVGTLTVTDVWAVPKVSDFEPRRPAATKLPVAARV